MDLKFIMFLKRIASSGFFLASQQLNTSKVVHHSTLLVKWTSMQKLPFSSNNSSEDIAAHHNFEVDKSHSSQNVQSLENITKEEARKKISAGPSLQYFIHNSHQNNNLIDKETTDETIPTTPAYLTNNMYQGLTQKVYFDVYGCQMNVNDTEVIWSILKSNGYTKTDTISSADIILIVTCAIREGAETKVWNRLKYLKSLKNARLRDKKEFPLKIGVLGCMAERLKEKLVEKEKSVDVVAGPDSYRDLPRLLALTQDHQTAINVMLSIDETYADITPVRLNQNSVSAFVSIMRGCDNMCSYCIVPFTRGRERSRPISSILDEVRYLSEQGVKEITLLGQNVNSYRDTSSGEVHCNISAATKLAKGFHTVYKTKVGGMRFADLLDRVADVDPNIRIRFTSPHPKDFPDESGNNAVLERMRRGYTRESYLELVQHVREMLPGVALSSDFICGFCGETDEEFDETISLMQQVKYNVAYLFPYSLREKTHAHRRMTDNVLHEDKIRRLERMVAVYRAEADLLNQKQIGSIQLVLVEGESKRSKLNLAGRNEANIKVIFPTGDIPGSRFSTELQAVQPGDYIVVQVNSANSQVLKGIPLYHSSVVDFARDTNPHLFHQSHASEIA
ncbi:hypothetical protein B566_EDAN013403 [Ephemera danica]|nr:hypothetical protein B566_EDAN013403 [Ephemera danica]